LVSIFPILILSFLFSSFETNTSSDLFRIVFYNVENLFDTSDNPTTKDEEFTPTGAKNWTKDRYNKKLSAIAKVLTSINSEDYPELIGLCEVENKHVLTDLITKTKLNKYKYGIVHEESPDFRGIDVALLYRKDEFTYLSHKKYEVDISFHDNRTTRDILHVTGKAKNNEVIHVFVNHWSSRRGGVEKTESKRVAAANVLRGKVDSLFKGNPNHKIVIIGDFNDEPMNNSILDILSATNTIAERSLYNTAYNKDLQKEGTYNYKGTWNMLDQIIVSFGFFMNHGLTMLSNDIQIFKPDWILYKSSKTGRVSPNRTYGGNNYYGGYSDHLPVYVELKFE